MICKNCADLADDKVNHDVADCDHNDCFCQHKELGAWRGSTSMNSSENSSQ